MEFLEVSLVLPKFFRELVESNFEFLAPVKNQCDVDSYKPKIQLACAKI